MFPVIRKLCAFLVAVCVCAASAKADIVTDLIHYYQFDNSANDYKTTANGTATGVTYSDTTALFGGYSAYFDGAASVNIGQPTDMKFGAAGDFSFALWVNTSGMNGWSTFIGNKDWDNAGTQTGVVFTNYSAGNLCLNMAPDRTDVGKNGELKYVNNAWQFLAGTVDRDGKISIYVGDYASGTLKSFAGTCNAKSSIDTGKNWIIGGDADGGSATFAKGYFDDFGIWNSALSASDIGTIFGAGRTGMSLANLLETNRSAASGEWNAAGNWSTGAAPGSADIVTVSGHAMTLNTADGAAGVLNIGDSGSVSIAAGKSLAVSNDLTILSGGRLNVAGSFTTNGGGTPKVTVSNGGALVYDIDGGSYTFAGTMALLTTEGYTFENGSSWGVSTANALALTTELSDPAYGFVKAGAGATTISGAGSKVAGSLFALDGGNATVSGGVIWNAASTTIAAGTTLKFVDQTPKQENAIAFVLQGGTLEFDMETTGMNGHDVSYCLNNGQAVTISGDGTFVKSGSKDLAASSGSGASITIALNEGSRIEIREGTLRNGGHGNQTWTNNHAVLDIAAGAKFDLWDGNRVYVGGLTGTGTVMSYGTNENNLRGPLTMNVASGKTFRFDGTVDLNATTSPATRNMISKAGAGTQILAGTLNYNGGTLVEGGTLQIGDGTAASQTGFGTGNLSVADGATLALKTNANLNIVGVVSGTGTITNDLSPEINMTNAANTFAGTLNINKESGVVNAASIGAGAKINLNGAGTKFALANAADLTFTGKISGVGEFEKSGAGTLTLYGPQTYTGKTTLSGGSLVADVAKMQTSGFEVTANTTWTPVVSAPWKLTNYVDTTTTGNISPTSTLSASAEIIDRGYDYKQDSGANSGNARALIKYQSALSYTTEIWVPNDLTLDLAGHFDDWAGAWVRPINDDGTLGDWQALMAYGSQNIKVAVTNVALKAGHYILDVRVGDNAGNVCCTSDYKSGTKNIGIGVRASTGSTATDDYLTFDIDPTNGNVAFSDGSISNWNANPTFDKPVQIAAGSTLTLDNPYAATKSVTLTGAVTGPGSLAFTAANATRFNLAASVEGSLSVGPNVELTTQGKPTIGGNLTLDPNSVYVLNQGENLGALTVTGDLFADGATFNVTIDNAASDFKIVADSASLNDTKFNITYTGAALPEATPFTFLETTDEAPAWNLADINLTFTDPNTVALLQFADGNYQLLVGDASSLPEPSTWLMFLLALGAVGFLRRRR